MSNKSIIAYRKLDKRVLDKSMRAHGRELRFDIEVPEELSPEVFRKGVRVIAKGEAVKELARKQLPMDSFSSEMLEKAKTRSNLRV
jgi:hypothetical protein